MRGCENVGAPTFRRARNFDRCGGSISSLAAASGSACGGLGRQVADLREQLAELTAADDEWESEPSPDPALSQQPIRDYVARRNPEGPIFAMRYESSEQIVTERVVMPVVVDSESRTGLFEAYCYLRDDLRHFRIERVQQFLDPETGEVFVDFDDALVKGVVIADRWKRERKRRRKAGEKLGVRRSER